jgi:hypothetical protein
MEQGMLWELDERTNSEIPPIWGQLDPVAQTDVMGKLSMLMLKAVHPHPSAQINEKENDHE